MNLPSATLLGQAILSGIFIGALYGLLGLGLSLSWGLLRQINLAYFALAFLAAYLCYQLSSVGGMDPLASACSSFASAISDGGAPVPRLGPRRHKVPALQGGAL